MTFTGQFPDWILYQLTHMGAQKNVPKRTKVKYCKLTYLLLKKKFYEIFQVLSIDDPFNSIYGIGVFNFNSSLNILSSFLLFSSIFSRLWNTMAPKSLGKLWLIFSKLAWLSNSQLKILEIKHWLYAFLFYHVFCAWCLITKWLHDQVFQH